MDTLVKPEQEHDIDMPEHIDFSNAMPNKYAARYAKGTNLMLIDPDVLDVFPDAEAVNDALRALAAIIRERSKGEAGDGVASPKANQVAPPGS